LLIDSSVPETRHSLLARVCCSDDEGAWEDFVEIYRPAIYRTARYCGLQPADAEDVIQQVLLSVARALRQRPHDPARAKFRTWLGRVTRNAALNAIQRGKPDRGSGDSAVQRQLLDVSAGDGTEEFMDRELQKERIRRSAEAIKPEFEVDTWHAFWWTAIEGREIGEVAEQLGKSVGSVYAARSRVIRRLRDHVQQ
jgi:RNA polymerase sigma-70 factor (ECF subfamily)